PFSSSFSITYIGTQIPSPSTSNPPPTTEIYTLSLHDALPIYTCISLLPYDDLLPKAAAGKLRYYEKLGIYPQEGVPLPVLKQECADAIVVMQRDGILSLLLRLSFDISKLQNSFSENRATNDNSRRDELSDEEADRKSVW